MLSYGDCCWLLCWLLLAVKTITGCYVDCYWLLKWSLLVALFPDAECCWLLCGLQIGCYIDLNRLLYKMRTAISSCIYLYRRLCWLLSAVMLTAISCYGDCYRLLSWMLSVAKLTAVFGCYVDYVKLIRYQFRCTRCAIRLILFSNAPTEKSCKSEYIVKTAKKSNSAECHKIETTVTCNFEVAIGCYVDCCPLLCWLLQAAVLTAIGCFVTAIGC
jgi:hypothetical protein